MKQFASAIVMLFLAVTSHGQLVNGGFETSSAMPNSNGQWNLVNGWQNAGSAIANPDYYRTDAGNVVADLPETPVAIVQPSQGNALMGLMVSSAAHVNKRIYLTSHFSEPLRVGDNYQVSFKITNGIKTNFSPAGIGVSNLGLYFSTAAPTQNQNDPINVTPQMQLDTVLFSHDWTTITFSFAVGIPYEYMTFGMFGNVANIDFVDAEGSGSQMAYYFVDDFQLKNLTHPESHYERTPPGEAGGSHPAVNVPESISENPFFVPNSFSPNGDGNNEAFKPVAGIISEWELSVFSKWGELLFRTADENLGWDGLYNGKSAEAGTYVWEVSYRGWDEATSTMVNKVDKGVVTLIR